MDRCAFSFLFFNLVLFVFKLFFRWGFFFSTLCVPEYHVRGGCSFGCAVSACAGSPV